MKVGFVFPCDALYLKDLDGAEGVLLEPLVFASAQVGAVMAPAGFQTDFASIPRGLWNVLPKRGKHDRAAVLHDAAYRGRLRSSAGRALHLSKDAADALFLEAMQASGVRWWSRTLMYRAVTWFGGPAYRAGQRIKHVQRVGDDVV